MIEIYSTNIRKIENGYIVFLNKFDLEKEEMTTTEEYAFVGKNEMERAFQFAKAKLGNTEVPEVKY